MNDGPKQWMQKTLASWLSKKDWSTEELTGFLQGYGLPPVGHDEEPHVWLLRGLPDRPRARKAAVRELTKRVVALLESKPDVTRPGRRPDQVLYNLLMLMASLQQPEFAEPLHKLYLRHAREHTLGNHAWLGLQLSARLRDALSVNQTDGRYRSVWVAMLKGKPGPLPGFPTHGFYGLLYMPTSRSRRLTNVGFGLKLYARSVEHETDKGKHFKPKLERVRAELSKIRYLDRKLHLVARVYTWPQWAKDLL